MKWSLKLGSLAGIKVYIHWTFLILLGWVLFTQWQLGNSWQQATNATVLILAIFGCVVLHELGHALMARRFKIGTRDITLLPIGGLARLQKIPEEPKQELLVALAGPAVNVGISVLIAMGLWLAQMPLLPETYDFQQLKFSSFLSNLFLVNLVLAAFNLIPAFPMDGGRVFRAMLAFKLSRVQATRIAASIGQLIAIAFAFIGLFYNPVLLLIAIFVYLGAQFEMGQVENKSLLQDYTVGDVMMRSYKPLHPRDGLLHAVALLLDSQEKDFVVVAEGRVVGLLSSNHIIQALKQGSDKVSVQDVMIKNFRELKPKESLMQVFEEFQMKKISILPVVQEKKLIGVLNLENVTEFIMIQHAHANQQGGAQLWWSPNNMNESQIT